MTACETHPDREATGACTGCGRFVCRACDVHTDRVLCATCAARERGRGAVAGVPAAREAASPRPPSLGAPPALTPLVVPSWLEARVATRAPTTGQRWAWVPIVAISFGLFPLLFGGWTSLWALPFLAGGVWSGRLLLRRHRSEMLQRRALEVFRGLRSDVVHKDEVVRDHGLDPVQAEEVLRWLVANELLVADWTDLDRPVAYRRASA